MKERVKWLEMKNLDVMVEENLILSNINLSLYEGENTAILGPNGAGKSTLIKLIERTLYPIVKTNSFFKIYGDENINIWDLRQRIGYLSTEFESRISPYTIAQDVILSGFYGTNGSGKKKTLNQPQKRRVNKLVSNLGLKKNIYNKPFGHLSDGQKRYILLARALVNQPKVLVLDEPTHRLDVKSKYLLLSLLKSLCNSGITLLQVTHNVETIINQNTRIVLLKDGKIIDDASPDKCLSSKNLSYLYETPLISNKTNGYWQIYPDIR